MKIIATSENQLEPIIISDLFLLIALRLTEITFNNVFCVLNPYSAQSNIFVTFYYFTAVDLKISLPLSGEHPTITRLDEVKTNCMDMEFPSRNKNWH